LLIGSPTKKSINVTLENNTIVGRDALDHDSCLRASSLEKASVDGSPATPSAGSHTSGTAAAFPISFGILAVNRIEIIPRIWHSPAPPKSKETPSGTTSGTSALIKGDGQRDQKQSLPGHCTRIFRWDWL
jgi:hypothetical protein